MFPAKYWVEKLKCKAIPKVDFLQKLIVRLRRLTKTLFLNDFRVIEISVLGFYFLLESHHFSAFHRIQSDEMWHFYAGDALNVYYIDNEDIMQNNKTRKQPRKCEVFQAVVPAGVWFGSKPAIENSYSLVGCTVAPGFDFADFEMPDRQTLLQEFPQHQEIIKMLTH